MGCQFSSAKTGQTPHQPPISLPLCLLTHKYPQAVIYKPPHMLVHTITTQSEDGIVQHSDFRATQTTRMFAEQRLICVHLLIDSFLIFITLLPQIYTLFWSHNIITLPGSFYPNSEFKALIFIVVLWKAICLTFPLSDIWNSFLLTFLITRDVYV